MLVGESLNIVQVSMDLVHSWHFISLNSPLSDNVDTPLDSAISVRGELLDRQILNTRLRHWIIVMPRLQNFGNLRFLVRLATIFVWCSSAVH